MTLDRAKDALKTILVHLVSIFLDDEEQ